MLLYEVELFLPAAAGMAKPGMESQMSRELLRRITIGVVLAFSLSSCATLQEKAKRMTELRALEKRIRGSDMSGNEKTLELNQLARDRAELTRTIRLQFSKDYVDGLIEEYEQAISRSRRTG